MNKETFHKIWYFRLLRLCYWSTLIFITGTLTVFAVLGMLGIYEEDIPMAGLLWAGIVASVYWLAKRVLYHVLFGERIVPRRDHRGSRYGMLST
jgi:hypothetical protein